jgi:hypothetical protein
MAEQITYIAISETYRIEVMPSGNWYPQRLINSQWREQAEGWAYWKTGNRQKHFKTERAARKFLANL